MQLEEPAAREAWKARFCKSTFYILDLTPQGTPEAGKSLNKEHQN